MQDKQVLLALRATFQEAAVLLPGARENQRRGALRPAADEHQAVLFLQLRLAAKTKRLYTSLLAISFPVHFSGSSVAVFGCATLRGRRSRSVPSGLRITSNC